MHGELEQFMRSLLRFLPSTHAIGGGGLRKAYDTATRNHVLCDKVTARPFTCRLAF